MMFAFVVIHAGCFTIALGSSYGPVMKLPFMIWGTAATVIAGLMLFQGMLYLRRKWYEVFLIGHIILAIFSLLAHGFMLLILVICGIFMLLLHFGDSIDLLELLVYFALDSIGNHNVITW